MLSLANIKSSGAAAHYYENDDYYAKDSLEHKERSEWFGKGAEKLGLKGNIDKENFKQVLEGNLPNGEVLGRQENSKRVHAPGIDLTFSAPKSVSIQAEVYGDTRIYAAHKKAMLTALKYVEGNLVETRKTIDGELKYEKVNNITVAMFRHNTSRNLDPQLHTHCVLANAIERSDKEWKSAFFGKIFENKKFIGQIYRAELAYELKQLGYELRITGKDSSFELEKIPERLIKLFSSRSKEINNAAENIGVADAKAKADLTLKTRGYKKDVSKEVLQEKWQETVKQYETNQENQVSNKSEISAAPKVIDYLSNKWEEFCKKFDLAIVSKIRHISDDIMVKRNLKVEECAVEYATAHLSERSAVWEATALRSVAMEYAIGHVCYEKLEAYIQKLHKEGMLLQGKRDDGLLATPATLSKELETVDLMKQGKGKVTAIYTQGAIQEKLSNTSLRQGQKEAVALILSTKDRVVGVQGYAGVGKTYMLQHVRALAADSGYTVIGMAPSSSAAKTLEDETGIKSQTVHKFLFKYDGVIHGRATKSGTKDMKEEFKKTIIVLDEASLASTSQINGLMKISKELDVRVVLAGDIKQIEAVESGKPFYQLQRFDMSTACMSEIIRQDSLKLKGAIYNTIDSEITSAMKKLSCSTIEIDKDKITHELQEASGNRELRATEINNAVKGALVEEATKTWVGLSKEERKETLVISPSHSIREEINAGIRRDLIKEGTLNGEEKTMHTLHRHGLTDVQYSHYNNYKVGYVVLFNRSYSKLGVGKNEYLQVDRIDDKHGILYLKKQDGKTIKWRPDKIAGARKGSVEVYEPKITPIRVGEQLRWSRNSRPHPEVINARMFEITGLTATDISIRTETGESKVMKLNDSALKHMDYAYASTVHAAQGRTTKKVIGVMESKHPHLTNQKLFYVSISRAKEQAILITDDKVELVNTLQSKTGESLAATEHQAVAYSNKDYAQRSKEAIENMKRETTVDAKSLDSANLQSKSAHQPQISQNTKFNQSSKVNHHSSISLKIATIYSAMYSRIPEVLPEFGFVNKGNCYVSTTERKVDGSAGKKGKVYIYANNPGVLIDYTKGNQSIWDYVKDNHIPSATKAELFEYLTDAAGLNGAKSYNFTPTLVAESQQASSKIKVPEVKVDKKLLTDIHNLSQGLLFRGKNHALAYLKQGRGYDEASIKKMELGFISSKKAVAQHLKSQGWSDEKIKEAYKTLGLIGQTHKLIIPYKDKEGELMGFAARNIFYKDTDNYGKYLYTKGLSKSETLFNIHNTKGKDLLVVEGLFDCLHASSKGINNVVALGGTSFNHKQMELIQNKGIEKLAICLDQDNAGKEATQRIRDVVSKASSNIELKGVTLPKGMKDPDQLLREQGLDVLKTVVANAQPIQINSALQTNLVSNYKLNRVILDNRKVTEIELEK